MENFQTHLFQHFLEVQSVTSTSLCICRHPVKHQGEEKFSCSFGSAFVFVPPPICLCMCLPLSLSESLCVQVSQSLSVFLCLRLFLCICFSLWVSVCLFLSFLPSISLFPLELLHLGLPALTLFAQLLRVQTWVLSGLCGERCASHLYSEALGKSHPYTHDFLAPYSQLPRSTSSHSVLSQIFAL